jgi:hypothetical protein
MTEPRPPHDEEDLMRTWQGTPVSMPDPADLARQISDKMQRFDRRIRWRNAREYGAGVLLLAALAKPISEGRAAAIVMAAGALVALGRLWWKHRGQRPLDVATDAQTYQAAVLKRFDDQIQLLRGVRYWYLLPLYIPVLWITVERWQHDPRRAFMTFTTATVFFVLLTWLNERYGVRKLTDARAKVASMFDDAGK